MYPYRVFTLEQANRAVTTVADLTYATQQRLQSLREAYREAAGENEGASLEEKTRELLNDWAQAILELGAQPKGIFTVDFRSPDPNMLWCWAPDEERITHRHFAWESFKDRVELNAVEDDFLGCN